MPATYELYTRLYDASIETVTVGDGSYKIRVSEALQNKIADHETRITEIEDEGVPASLLVTTGSPVNVGDAAPPTAGQVLKATDATHATWQDESGGGGGSDPVSEFWALPDASLVHAMNLECDSASLGGWSVRRSDTWATLTPSGAVDPSSDPGANVRMSLNEAHNRSYLMFQNNAASGPNYPAIYQRIASRPTNMQVRARFRVPYGAANLGFAALYLASESGGAPSFTGTIGGDCARIAWTGGKVQAAMRDGGSAVTYSAVPGPDLVQVDTGTPLIGAYPSDCEFVICARGTRIECWVRSANITKLIFSATVSGLAAGAPTYMIAIFNSATPASPGSSQPFDPIQSMPVGVDYIRREDYGYLL